MQSTSAFALTSPRIQRSPTNISYSSQARFILMDNLMALRAMVSYLSKSMKNN